MMHPTVVVAAAAVLVAFARVFILTHCLVPMPMALSITGCRDAPAAILPLAADEEPGLDGLPASLADHEVVLLVQDGVTQGRLVAAIDTLRARGARVVVQGRPETCRR